MCLSSEAGCLEPAGWPGCLILGSSALLRLREDPYSCQLSLGTGNLNSNPIQPFRSPGFPPEPPLRLKASFREHTLGWVALLGFLFTSCLPFSFLLSLFVWFGFKALPWARLAGALPLSPTPGTPRFYKDLRRKYISLREGRIHRDSLIRISLIFLMHPLQ